MVGNSSNTAPRLLDGEDSVDGQELILLINGHSERVTKRTIACATTKCCHCGAVATEGSRPFTFHGVRARRFFVLVGHYVCNVAARLSRWRCPHCHRTFTDYPPFACPHKAYTMPQIVRRAGTYVSDPAASYRKGVRSANLPIFHAGPADTTAPRNAKNAMPCLATVAHSSLFHWVTALGRRPLEIHRAELAPAARKYTSQRRRSILVACWANCSALLSRPAPGVLLRR